MPKQQPVINKCLEASEECKILYRKFYRCADVYREVFDSFLEFYEWSMENGFQIGAKFKRKDENKPYNPDNCYWEQPKDKGVRLNSVEAQERIKRSNKTVNRIRVHYGLPPFENKEIRDI